jgi:hypothetical protein
MPHMQVICSTPQKHCKCSARHNNTVLQEMNHPYQNLEGHPLWQPIQKALGDMTSNQDISITTDSRYVIGFLLSTIIQGNPNLCRFIETAEEIAIASASTNCGGIQDAEHVVGGNGG